MNARSRIAALLLAVAYLGVGSAGYLFGDPRSEQGGAALVTWWAAIAALALTAWATRRPTPLPTPVASWLIPAVVAPLALFPLLQTGPGSSPAVAVLWPAAVVPLGLSVASLAGERGWMTTVVWVLAGAAAAIGLAAPHLVMLTPLLAAAQFVTVTSIAWAPWTGLAVVGQGRSGIALPQRSGSEVLARAALLLACLLPALTGTVLLVRWDVALGLVAVLSAVLVVGARAAVGPLAGATARANLQRDLAVAVSEAERARLAADLHDGPLQSVLLLARRLEERDDEDGAELAREIATELRELSGDLRLPLLDDLGVGPALDWLVMRVQRLTGLEISASWEADGRPPAPVELAAFRIAQEALANAVRHGRPPIRLTCRAASEALFLAIEDAGAGDGPAEPNEPGRVRIGILGMAQRAEQIGARLVVDRSPSRGMLVSVEWQQAPA